MPLYPQIWYDIKGGKKPVFSSKPSDLMDENSSSDMIGAESDFVSSEDIVSGFNAGSVSSQIEVSSNQQTTTSSNAQNTTTTSTPAANNTTSTAPPANTTTTSTAASPTIPPAQSGNETTSITSQIQPEQTGQEGANP